MLLSFYVQSFIFSVKDSLILATKRRFGKVIKISFIIETILYLVVGFFGYMSMGENYIQDLFLLKKPYPGESQTMIIFYNLLMVIFFLACFVGVAVFNPPIRDCCFEVFSINHTNTNYIIVSMLPVFIMCVVAFLKPDIIDIFGLIGLSVCTINGFIIP